MIKTTVVGSYPVPMWLRMVSNRESLQDAMLVVLKTQELAGIDVVADGELYRWDINHAETNGMIDYFIRPMAGIDCDSTFEEIEDWRARADMRYRSSPAGVVRGSIAAGRLNLPGDYRLFRDLSDRPKKFTVTSPYMLAKVLYDQHYGNLETLVMALAEVLKTQVQGVDAQVIQVDEANITGNPADGPIAAAGINRVLEGVRAEKAVHLCFGNYGGQTVQKGTYARLIAFLNAIEVDHLVLEVARRPKEELSVFRDVRPAIGLGIGVIDIKDNEVERPDEVARRIEAAANCLGAERIRYVHPDIDAMESRESWRFASLGLLEPAQET
jgi:5-methyltetrahydropteroyltriglutamate--homocysteine methyltransferase